MPNNNAPLCSFAIVAQSQERAGKDERHAGSTANNNRQCGSVLPRYLKIEMWQALDLHYFLCPTWRRFGASVLLEDSQVMSAPLRPGRALTLNEHTMRDLPLGTKSNVTLPQRCAQCRSHRVDHSLNAADSLKISNVFKSAAHRFPTEALRRQRKPYFDAAVN